MAPTAGLLITHRDPDLDAVGFVYSARKVFGLEVPVECRPPTPPEMRDPTVIVGDLGLPGYEDIGHSPALNNFDHHYSHIEDRSATWLFNQVYDALRQDIVEYIDAVDIQGGKEDSEVTLKVAMVGVRVQHYGADPEILAHGCRPLKWLEETGRAPDDISGLPQRELDGFLQLGQEELRRIREELAAMERCTTKRGRMVGYLMTRSPVFSVVKEEMFALGIDLAMVYSLTKDRYSIAGNVRGGQSVRLKQEGLVKALNAAEGSRGMPAEREWGGHEDRIGSPKPAGSFLSADEVLRIVRATL